MNTLHLINHPAALAECLDVAASADTILLLENGVYAVVDLAPGRRLCALETDVRARGLAARLPAHVELASDEDFVALVETHQPVVTWR